jgi:hypothetical protein
MDAAGEVFFLLGASQVRVRVEWVLWQKMEKFIRSSRAKDQTRE